MEITALYIEFHSTIFNYIKSKVSSKEDAEDILHNVFVKIVNHTGTISQKEKLANWIFIITRNAIYDYYRKKGTGKSEGIDERLIENTPEEDAPDATHGLEKCMMSFIDRLPEQDKHVLIEAELKGVKQKELAEKYSMPYSSLRSRVQRGREKLKQMLTDCCRIELDRRGNIVDATPKNACAENMCKSCEN